jgi:chorismate mutase
MNISITPLEKWGLPVKDLFISAGPCSAESEKQVIETARGLVDYSITFFRGGIWKPRTHPGSFEGVGNKGLKWLSRVRKEFGIPVGTEVANAKHVRACLKHNVDILWIGARTTPNPFAVQEIADALKGSDIPVLIKNPVSPDLDLWIGAIRRLNNAGVKKIGAIHRGFSTSNKILYRNDPNWKIPIELKRQLPGLPLICDPSHICGKSKLLFSVAQEALDLLYNGLMIEVHSDPSKALSDSSQQIKPSQFISLIRRLTLKKELSSSEKYQARISELRAEVDSLDDHVIKLLGKRMEIAKKMGILKHKNDVSTLQPGRWKEIIKSRVAMGNEHNLTKEFIFQLFQAIHEEAIQQQEEDIWK